MQNQLLGFFAITTVAFGLLCGLMWTRTRTGQAEVVVLQARQSEQAVTIDGQASTIASLRRDQERWQEVLEGEQAEVARLRLATNALGAELAKRPWLVQAMALPASGPAHAVVAALLVDPEVRAWYRSQLKLVMEPVYAEVFEEWKLGEDERRRLWGWLAELRVLQALEGGAGLPEAGAAVRAGAEAARDTRRELEESMRGMLGEERYARAQEFAGQVGDRLWLRQFRVELEGGPLEATADQVARLTRAVMQERRDLPGRLSGAATVPPPGTDPESRIEARDAQERVMDGRVIERAREILGPDQVTALERFLIRQRRLSQIGLELARRVLGTELGTKN